MHPIASGNLEAFSALTPFVGRRRELRNACRQMEAGRLITVTGPGGVGKTRFAFKLADRVRRVMNGGVWVAGLAAVTRDDDLADAVASALNIDGRSTSAIVQFFGPQNALLVLDNCEHLVAACAQLSSNLLRSCPNLKILATSREPLKIAGETIFSLPPLSLADPMDASAVSRSESVELFLQRATHAVPSLALEEDMATVAGICYRLDGLPLAIELAAARLTLLSPSELLERLSEPLRLLTGGSRTEPERQRTLKSSIAWSYDLCSQEERRLWQGLAVFAGEFPLDAAERIAERIVPSAQPLDLVQSLLEKSVLTISRSGTEVWLSMLVSLKEFGIDQLRAEGALDVARRAHLSWHVALIGDAEKDWFSPRQAYWQSKFARILPDVRLALSYALSGVNIWEEALALLLPMWRPFWQAQGRMPELREWLDGAIASASVADPSVVDALILSAYINGVQGGTTVAGEQLAAARELADELDYERGRVYMDIATGTLLPDGDAALALYERSFAAAWSDPTILIRTGIHIRLTLMHDRLNHRDRTAEPTQQILSFGEETEERFERAYLLYGLGVNALNRGEHEKALAVSQQSIRLTRDLPATIDTAHAVETIAALKAAQGDTKRAARLFGVADLIWTRIGVQAINFGQFPADRRRFEQSLRERMSELEFDQEYRRGRSDSFESGILAALDEQAVKVTPLVAQPPTRLTKRETEVADLITTGLSDREIAAKLLISIRTAEGHVQRILVKLGFKSRAQIAASINSEAEWTSQQ